MFFKKTKLSQSKKRKLALRREQTNIFEASEAASIEPCPCLGARCLFGGKVCFFQKIFVLIMKAFQHFYRVLVYVKYVAVIVVDGITPLACHCPGRAWTKSVVRFSTNFLSIMMFLFRKHCQRRILCLFGVQAGAAAMVCPHSANKKNQRQYLLLLKKKN